MLPGEKASAGSGPAPVEPSAANLELHEEFEDIPLFVSVMTMVNYMLLTVLGYFRDFLRNQGFDRTVLKQEKPNQAVRYDCCNCFSFPR